MCFYATSASEFLRTHTLLMTELYTQFHCQARRFERWLFYVKFSLLRTAFEKLLYTLTVESVYTREQRRCAEADRDPQNIWNSQKNCGSFVDATSSEP